MDQSNLNVQMDVKTSTTESIKATLAGSDSLKLAANRFDPEFEAKQLLQLMGVSGVLPQSVINQILEKDEIQDAEIVEETDGDGSTEND